MGRSISLEIDIKPIGKESIRGGRSFYTSPKTKKYMDILKGYFTSANNKDVITGPIIIKIVCEFERPKSVKADCIYMTRKPDIDNIQKAIFDSGNNILWKDDSQISGCIIKKIWSDRDKLSLTITEVE